MCLYTCILDIARKSNTHRAVIVSGHLDNNIRIWDSRTGNSIQELMGIHAGQVTAVDMFPGLFFVLFCSTKKMTDTSRSKYLFDDFT